jgi:hypothetical protein
MKRHCKLQEMFWEWSKAQIRAMGPVDILIGNGDLIDGPNTKDHGVELITPDCIEQAQMAIECLELFRPKKTVIVRGTPYHTEMFESIIANHFGTDLKMDLTCKINNFVFDVRHHTGGSSTSHTHGGAARKEMMFKILESVIDGGVRPDVLIRSHVHNFMAYEDLLGKVFITPGMQLNSAYGKLRCSGLTSIGFLEFIVPDRKEDGIAWHAHLLAKKAIRGPLVVL